MDQRLWSNFSFGYDHVVFPSMGSFSVNQLQYLKEKLELIWMDGEKQNEEKKEEDKVKVCWEGLIFWREEADRRVRKCQAGIEEKRRKKSQAGKEVTSVSHCVKVQKPDPDSDGAPPRRPQPQPEPGVPEDLSPPPAAEPQQQMAPPPPPYHTQRVHPDLPQPPSISPWESHLRTLFLHGMKEEILTKVKQMLIGWHTAKPHNIEMYAIHCEHSSKSNERRNQQDKVTNFIL